MRRIEEGAEWVFCENSGPSCPKLIDDHVNAPCVGVLHRYGMWRSDPGPPRSTPVDSGSTDDAVGPQIYDVVQKPLHYNSHPSGVECIQITEHMGYLLGNAIKYIWRADLKGKPIQDLRKAVFYIEREIAKRESLDDAI